MPYIGNEVGNRFVASKAASVYSGNGSTTAFTLEHAVGSDEDILVSVDGVIQEPSVAYAVSSGTTLTFTAAPSSNSGNNIFVYYLFRTVATVDHPSTSSLQATDGTFSSTLNVTGETTLATHLNMGDGDKIKLGASGDLEIYHDGSNSHIDDTGTGVLVLRGNSKVELQKYTGEVMLTANADGAVELYHNDSKKIETTSSGVTVTGDIANASGSLTIDSASQMILDAAGGNHQLLADGTEYGRFFVSSGDFYIYNPTSDKDIKFYGNDGGSAFTAMSLDMSDAGAATLNNGLTLTDGDLVLASGHGISFAATGGPTNGTGSNETLSDYEEGTFTGGLDQYAGTPSINTAVYTKVGRLVTASMNIVLDGTSDASGFIINGLPFASLSTNTSSQGGFINYSNTAYTNPIRVLQSSTTTKAYLYKQDGTTLTYNDFGNDRNIRITFVYFT